MNKLTELTLCIFICIIWSCNDKDTALPDSYTLNTDVTDGHFTKGFSFKDLKIIAFPNSKNAIPDFILSCHINETGDIVGPMLSNPVLENRFIFLKSYDNPNSAQNHFDTLVTINKSPYQTFAFDIKPFDIWQIKTSAGETGVLLVLETRTEKINLTPFAEIKFKARMIIP